MTLRRALVGLVLADSLSITGGQAATATGTPPPNTNEVAYWCADGHGFKYDGLTTTGFVVPAPPTGWHWTLLVLKAGSDQSTDGENEPTVNPVVGQTYYHPSGKTLSHAILCKAPDGTTTTYTSTTGASTTIATTTTGATTTAATTTVPVTNPNCEGECTTTTGGSTTTTATTLPTTTTTARPRPRPPRCPRRRLTLESAACKARPPWRPRPPQRPATTTAPAATRWLRLRNGCTGCTCDHGANGTAAHGQRILAVRFGGVRPGADRWALDVKALARR